MILSACRHRATRVAAVALLACGFSAASPAADPNKVLHFYFVVAETGFDPAQTSEIYSASVNEAIFERLLTYDYLARPAKLVPMVAEAMPEISDGGKTYTFHIKKGILFAPDPAFSLKRFFDPKVKSPYAFMLEDIVGLKEAGERAAKSNRFDYGAKVEGLTAPDRYTLVIRLAHTDYVFPFKIAHTAYAAVAREVIERYADDPMGHPVGTGAYMLKEWTRAAKIVLVANPNYRGFTWDFAPSEPDWDNALIAQMKGKTMPQIGRIEISIMEEPQAVWLAFLKKELDYINLPADFREKALDREDHLLPELKREDVRLFRAIDPDITYTSMNFRDPVIGGMSREKIALRRAIIMAYDQQAEIDVLRKRLAIHDEMPIPPGVVGYDPRYRSINPYDPVLANKLLDYFGYKRGKDGWRTMPDGSPLLLRIATETGTLGRQYDELWKKSLDAVGLRVVFDISKFGDNVKAARACKLMMWGKAWGADYPDGDNFMQLLYGPNIGQSNDGCYDSKSFNALYEKAQRLPDSPERNHLFIDMTRQMEVDGAWRIGVSRMRNELLRPWVLGYKRHPILAAEWQYLDLEPR